MEFLISATTDIGIKKSINQDSLFVRKITTKTGKMVFAVLCDGMGGLERGEIASTMLLTAFSDWMYERLPILSQYELEDFRIREEWTNVVDIENNKMREYVQNEGYQIGTTITAMLLTEKRYYLLNIGDSRAYKIKETVKQLTIDHTVIAKEIELGNITLEQAEIAPIGNVLTRCVGVAETVYPDLFFGDIEKDTIYMLCSDGFRHRITSEEIREYLFYNNNKR